MENIAIIDHVGLIQYETIGELIRSFKQKVDANGVHVSTYKKVLLVMIESLENIMKHSAKCPENHTKSLKRYLPVFSIVKRENQFIIVSSNFVSKQNSSAFKKKLDYLSQLNQHGLKEYYKETITNGMFSKRGGAGLGLIEIAKVSGNKIAYEFTPMNKLCDQFKMTIIIEETLK